MRSDATPPMAIEITGLPPERRLRPRVARRLRGVLARLHVRPVRAQVAFLDENGPKGGLDIRCALTARLPYRPAIRVEHLAATPQAAFDGAFDTLVRQLERYRERQRERRRRPKKYYVAKRLLQPEAGGGGGGEG